MINSPTNANVKYVTKLQADRRFRLRERKFVAEGTRWLRDLRASSAQPHVYHTPAWQQTELVGDWDTTVVTADIMAKMSNVETPSGVLAVVPMPVFTMPVEPTLLLVLDRIQNPGNLGTMLRTAAAAGVDAVLLSPGCVDLWNPKVVRGTMGTLLRLPVFTQSWAEIGEITVNMRVFVSELSDSTSYTDVDWQRPSALIVGNEAQGVSDEAQQLGHAITIPMHNETESLNAAMAAGVILFEAVRQRRING